MIATKVGPMLFVLDLDDTLYLERDFVRSGYQAVDVFLSQEHALNDFFDFAWREFCGGNASNIINRFLELHHCCTETLLQTTIETYRNHAPLIKLLPDSMDFLNRHPKEHYAMITDGYASTQWNKIRALHLEKYIGRIIVTGDWGKEYWKPNPRAYLEVQGNRRPDECIYIADNPQKDFQAPLSLEWHKSIRIRRPGALHDCLPTDGHCMEITSFYELDI